MPPYVKAVPQGKSHVSFCEREGNLYFATHMGYYQVVAGKELVGVPPRGYKPYPGGLRGQPAGGVWVGEDRHDAPEVHPVEIACRIILGQDFLIEPAGQHVVAVHDPALVDNGTLDHRGGRDCGGPGRRDLAA